MARLTIFKDNCMNSTAVSNFFIDNYMKDANDAQLKVYFYLLRMLNADHDISVSDIADKFNHTEKEVMRALKYWEDRQLLDLVYDGGQNLVGVHLREFAEDSLSDRTVPENSVKNIALKGPECDIPKGSDAASPNEAAAKKEKDVPAFRKPSYTPEQLRAFKDRQETAQLLFIAQSYIGRPLTPNEMKSILFFMDELHFSEDLIDYLLQYCVDRGKKDFKYIEKVAISWAEQGIVTPRQAQNASARYDKNVYAVMNRLGKSGSPTDKELEYIRRWMEEYGFANDIIFEACDRTVMATDHHRFEYADRILKSWLSENVRRKSDILQIDQLYQQKRKSSQKPAAAANKFNQFKQNDYNFEELERQLLSN